MLKDLRAGVIRILIAAPLLVSAQAVDGVERPARDTREAKMPPAKHGGGPYEADDIIGTRINNIEGKELGEIDQLLIDRNGKVTRVVIGVGGRGGVGEKRVMVPWSDLRFAPVADGKKNAITMDEAKLQRAPGYERSARSASASPGTDLATTDSDRDGRSIGPPGRP